MLKKVFFEKILLWKNIFKRIYYFKKMYPLKIIIKDIFLFPADYFINGKKIKTVRNVTFFITHKCNIRCKMCYFKEGLKDVKEMPLSLFKQIIDQIKKTNTSIQFGGGEPFMHPNILEMIEYTKKAGLPTQIFTNGILVTKDIADVLVKLGVEYINFTLLGNEETHSQVANVPNSYKKFYNNLEYLASNRKNSQIILNYTFSPWSFNDYHHAFELVKNLKLDGLRLQHYMYLLPEEIVLQHKVMKKIFNKEVKSIIEEYDKDVSKMAIELIKLKKFIKKDFGDINVQWAPMLSDDEINNWYSGKQISTSRKCLYPWRGIHIDADGKVYPCTKIYFEIGNTEGNNVLDVWNNDNMKMFRKQLKSKLYPACSRCCKL